MSFPVKYGPWAVVTGAAAGIGAAWAAALGRRGLGVIGVDRDAEGLADLAEAMTATGARYEPVTVDLSQADCVDAVVEAVAGREVGLLVNNAAAATLPRAFTAVEPQRLLNELQVNCAAPLLLSRHFLPQMVARGRGGIVFMSSMASVAGMPTLAGYAATKGHLASLADSLWAELRGSGVDVLAVLPGLTDTPGLRRTDPDLTVPVPMYRPEEVVDEALESLGRAPRVLPGVASRWSGLLLERLLPRQLSLRFNAAVVARLYGRASSGFTLIQKPFTPASIRARISALLGGSPLPSS